MTTREPSSSSSSRRLIIRSPLSSLPSVSSSFYSSPTRDQPGRARHPPGLPYIPRYKSAISLLHRLPFGKAFFVVVPPRRLLLCRDRLCKRLSKLKQARPGVRRALLSVCTGVLLPLALPPADAYCAPCFSYKNIYLTLVYHHRQKREEKEKAERSTIWAIYNPRRESIKNI